LLHSDLRGLADMLRDIDMFRIHADLRRIRTDMYKLADLYRPAHLRTHADLQCDGRNLQSTADLLLDWHMPRSADLRQPADL
jgi:hypothetical protein